MTKFIASTETRVIECKTFDEAWSELTNLIYAKESQKQTCLDFLNKNGYCVVGYGFCTGQISIKNEA